MQRSTRIVRLDVYTALQEATASVESFVHIHHSNAGLAIASRDCGLNRRGPSPARKKRCVQIQTGEVWNLEHSPRQDLAVGNDHNHIGVERAHLLDRLP